MLAARDVMSSQLVTVSPEHTLRDVLKLFIEQGVSGVPVVDSQQNLVGIISEISMFDVLFDRSLLAEQVETFMTRAVVTVEVDESASTIAQMFALHGIRRLPVLERGRLVGIVTRRDLLSACLASNAALPPPAELLEQVVCSIVDS